MVAMTTRLFRDLSSVKLDYSSFADGIEGITVLNQDISDLDVARLAGAMAGSVVRVSSDTIITKDSEGTSLIDVPTIKLVVENEAYLEKPMERHILEQDTGGALAILDNSLFKLNGVSQGKNIAAQSVAYQIHTAKRLGFSCIQTVAAGRPGSMLTGWKVWPRMGYDGVVDEGILAKLPISERMKLPPEAAVPITVQRLLDACGRELWEQYGEAMPMSIDLKKLNHRARSLVSRFVEQENGRTR